MTYLYRCVDCGWEGTKEYQLGQAPEMLVEYDPQSSHDEEHVLKRVYAPLPVIFREGFRER